MHPSAPIPPLRILDAEAARRVRAGQPAAPGDGRRRSGRRPMFDEDRARAAR